MKTYGSMHIEDQFWVIDRLETHVCIKLKAIFTTMRRGESVPFKIKNTDENCQDLFWFTQRYPLDMGNDDQCLLKRGKVRREKTLNELDLIINGKQENFEFNGDIEFKISAREYQQKYVSVFKKVKSILNCDDLGLGKTASSIFTLTKEMLPAVVVCQTHLPRQWDFEIKKFTNLKTCLVNKAKPYELENADIYIFRYSQLAGWVDYFQTKKFKSVIFDEVQELRRVESAKHRAASFLCRNVEFKQGLSATPIFNYGIEAFNILHMLKPGCLGDRDSFIREWCGFADVVRSPKEFGSYLQSNFLMIRRTRQDVQKELPPVNKIVYTVETDEESLSKIDDLAYSLAMKVQTGSFTERGMAARELDTMVRQQTGIAKAKSVAQYVKMFLEAGQPVLLTGWHRSVYDIWMEELKDYSPALYTGTESGNKKYESAQNFIEGKTNLMIMSLRSGAGLNGLQNRCSVVVFGELDWSNAVHEQIVGRLNRDGQENQVTAIYLVSEDGSDPIVMNICGIKASQQHGILNPFAVTEERVSDDSKIQMLAKQYIGKRKGSKKSVVNKDVSMKSFMFDNVEQTSALDLFSGAAQGN